MTTEHRAPTLVAPPRQAGTFNEFRLEPDAPVYNAPLPMFGYPDAAVDVVGAQRDFRRLMLAAIERLEERAKAGEFKRWSQLFEELRREVENG